MKDPKGTETSRLSMYPQDPNYQHFPMQGCDYSKLPYIVDLWHVPSSLVLLEDLWIDHEQFGYLFPLAIFGSGNPWTCLGWGAKHVSSPWHLSREWLWSVCHLIWLWVRILYPTWAIAQPGRTKRMTLKAFLHDHLWRSNSTQESEVTFDMPAQQS